jgi:hypothetical protein
MAKIRNPRVFSQVFDIKPEKLADAGVFDPILNVDTRLFVDPLLLRKSSFKLVREKAADKLDEHFAQTFRVVRSIRQKGGISWRTALRMLTFREPLSTCLGYGKGTIGGSGIGQGLARRLVDTAMEIVERGIEDPGLFHLLPLIEQDLGADRISDMTCHTVKHELAEFTAEVCRDMGIETQVFELGSKEYELPVNPHRQKALPVLLVPSDILRPLPIATSWEEIADAAGENEKLRRKVNKHVGDIWSNEWHNPSKRELRKVLLNNKSAFETILEVVKKAEINSYDIANDPEGLFRWLAYRSPDNVEFSEDIEFPSETSGEAAVSIIETIIREFRLLVEKKGLWKSLWAEHKPLKEPYAQRIFFAVCHCFCKYHDIDVTPEADTGTGAVDFKFSKGYGSRILVEMKLSTNSRLVRAYEKQMEAYEAAEQPLRSYYLVVNVGGIGKKEEKLLELRNNLASKGKRPPAIEWVDGRRKASASKR